MYGSGVLCTYLDDKGNAVQRTTDSAICALNIELIRNHEHIWIDF